MVTQKDLQDLVKALNDVLRELDQRVSVLEESATKSASSRTSRKKSEEKS